MIIFKCDKCGKTQEVEEYGDIFNLFGWALEIAHQEYLCPECYKKEFPKEKEGSNVLE